VDALFVAILGLVAALAAPFVTYVVTARRFSGKIATSDATDLWAESKAIREWSQERMAQMSQDLDRERQRVTQLEARIKGLEEREDGLNQVISDQKAEIENLSTEVRKKQHQIDLKTEEVTSLEERLAAAKARIDELEVQVAP
jgi:chromosome segregation ATPase